jgi:ATP-dependent helicase HrpA
LRAQLRPRLRAQLAAATAPFERSGLREWTIGELPRSVALPGTGGSVRAYPALVDEGDSVAVRAFETPAAQAAAMHAGARALLRFVVASPLRTLQRGLSGSAALTLAGAPHGGAAAVLDDALNAALDELLASGGGPAWDEAGFAALRSHVTQRLPATTAAIVRAAIEVLDAAAELRARLDSLSADPALQPARLDVAGQLGSLIHPGFITATGTDRLPDVVRYLRAASRRLERLPDAVAADRDRMNAIGALEREYRARGGRAAAPAVHWMLQELRVAQFAQGLGTRGAASAKQIRRALAALPVNT